MTVSIRELKAQLSHYLAQARAGQVIRVTSHRKEIARIIGVPDTRHEGLDCLLAAGEARWRGGKPAGARIKLSEKGEPLSSIVLRERG